MPKTTTAKAARKARSQTAMPIVLRNVPSGCTWGWYSREDPRMHLQTLDETHQYKIWLESKGRRVVEPVGKIPARRRIRGQGTYRVQKVPCPLIRPL